MNIGSSYSRRGCTRLIPIRIGRGWACLVFRGWEGILLLGGRVDQAEECFVRFYGRIHHPPIKGLGLGLGVPLWGLLLLCGRGNGLVVPFTGVDVLVVGLDAPISVVVVESDLSLMFGDSVVVEESDLSLTFVDSVVVGIVICHSCLWTQG